MKAQKIITIITIILLVAILSVASFMGIYKLIDYKVKNIVPKYLLGKEFSNSRVIDLTVDDSVKSREILDKDGNKIEEEAGVEYTEENGYTVNETKENTDDVLTEENFKKSKRIIAKRLHDLGVDQYTIKLDKETGNIKLDITEDDNTEDIIASVVTKGKLEVVDSQSQEVLLDSGSIKSAKTVYGQSSTGDSTTVYLQVQFDKEGSKKLEEISKIYIETKDENEGKEDVAEEVVTGEQVETDATEEETVEEETPKKEVTIMLDGQEIRTTYFGDTITNGILNIPIGAANDNTSLQNYIQASNELKTLVSNGVMPITYTQTNYVQENSFNMFQNKIVFYLLIGIGSLACLLLIIKFKLKGLFAIILQTGYIALLLLVLRYTNIKITLTGLIGIAISIILNYIYIFLAFNNIKQNFVKETTAKYAIKLIPFYVIAVVFTFISSANISSVGMAMFWGIVLMYLYNLILTQITINTFKE